MPRHTTIEVLLNPPPDHPAVLAWDGVSPLWGELTHIEVLKEARKSAIYRLAGAGPDGTAVIAKRCLRITGEVERTILEEILPRLPLPALRLYGKRDEPDGEYCWLFLEDASGEAYSPFLEYHRQAAGRWLGLLHTAAAESAATARLPARGPRHYLEHLHAARDAILRNFANPALTEEGAAALRAVVVCCEELAAGWEWVERLCDGMPRTLVHGDFVAKNLRVDKGGEGIILAFDWEQAGWGVPAPDLGSEALPDCGAYGEVVRRFWRDMDAEYVDRLAVVGTLFRSLATLSWEASHLAFQWLERPLRNIQTSHSRIKGALRILSEQG